jgi:esterase/lipase superfamily enzyme
MAVPRQNAQRGAEYVHFEYVGRTGLTVLGPVTGRYYRFEATGMVAAVDKRDAPSLSAVPHLRGLV